MTGIIIGLIAFGGGAIFLLCTLQLVRFYVTRPRHDFKEANLFVESMKYTKFSINFLVIVGLIAVVIVAAVLVLAAPNSESISPAFTLFGTIAGYLATRRLTHASEDDQDRDDAGRGRRRERDDSETQRGGAPEGSGLAGEGQQRTTQNTTETTTETNDEDDDE